MMLLEIMNRYTTDKHTTHSYVEVYEKLLYPIRESATAILEIGVASGGSVRSWRDYFTTALIVGIDNNIQCIFQEDRILTILADQMDKSALKSLEKFGQYGFDVVIDDGSHAIEAQVLSLLTLWPLVRPGGLYVIEDIQDFNSVGIFKYLGIKDFLIHDLRSLKGRYDDVLVVFKKGASS